jgi:hypothetical protein
VKLRVQNAIIKSTLSVKGIRVDNYIFTIRVWTDGELTFSARYADAVSAVRNFQTFVDYGTAKHGREILLLEPNGKLHSKQFDAPKPL